MQVIQQACHGISHVLLGLAWEPFDLSTLEHLDTTGPVARLSTASAPISRPCAPLPLPLPLQIRGPD